MNIDYKVIVIQKDKEIKGKCFADPTDAVIYCAQEALKLHKENDTVHFMPSPAEQCGVVSLTVTHHFNYVRILYFNSGETLVTFHNSTFNAMIHEVDLYRETYHDAVAMRIPRYVTTCKIVDLKKAEVILRFNGEEK